MLDKRLNYSNLVRKVAEQTSLSQKDVDQVLSETLNIIKSEVSGGAGVAIRDFGVFETKVLGSRQSRDIHTGQMTTRPEQRVLRFRPSKNLRDEVRNQ